MTTFPQRIAIGLVAAGAAVAGVACGSSSSTIALAPGTGVQDIQPSDAPLEFAPRRRPHTEADVRFMSGMIAHHAQAVLMAGWAPSHGAGASIRRLCARIVVSQQDEIRLMQDWLEDVGEPVPDGEPMPMNAPMHGMQHEMSMPGMLTAEELARLDAARGAEFDRLLLTYMIRHHGGALVMVDELFGSYGAAQNQRVFQLASNIYADQTTEIARMRKMLAELTSGDDGRDASPPSTRS